MPNPKFAALDTHFLLELERGNPTHEGVIDALASIGFFFLATDTVLQELADLEFCSDNPTVKQLAIETTKHLGLKNILTPQLSAVTRGVAEIIADGLVTLFTDGTKNDGLIIAEAACHNCRILMTTRAVILGANLDAVRMALIRADVAEVFAINPDSILEIFKEFERLRKAPAVTSHTATVHPT